METPRNVAAAEPEEPSWIGRVIDDRYKVTEHLGEGGMGAVYVAEHLKLRKEVALKVIHPRFAGDGEVAARFAREAMASAQLEHPHVASALDYGTLPEGGAYLVMQLVRGHSVHDLIEGEGALPWQQACEIAAQVADALAAAHAAGIVHRDLKPDNILLRRHADDRIQVKVLDFGIARVAVEDGRAPEGAQLGKALTRVGTVMGTPGYMSPEQAMGESVDARADIYSLGVVLWEMIVGRDMFGTRELTAIVTQQLTEPAPPVGVNAPGPIPPQLDELVTAMLAGRAADRMAEASQVRDALRQLVFGTTGPVSGSHALPATADRSEATANTMLAKAVVDPTGPVPTTAAPTAPAWQALITSPRVAELRRKVSPQVLAAGCGALLALGVLGAIGIVALTGDEEPEQTQQAGTPPGFSLSKLLEMTPLPAPGPTVPPEVQERIDLVLESDDRRERRDAADWLLSHEPADDVPDFARAVAELETARGCRRKKPIVERIGEEELEEALPALQRMADTPRRGCGFLSMNDCYACLRRELSQAMAAIGGEAEEASGESEEPADEKGRRRRR